MLKTLLLSFLFLVTFTFIASSPVLPYFCDGNELVQGMREFEKAEQRDPKADLQTAQFYMGFVAGIYDSISSSLCPSDNPTVGQVSKVVAQYLDNHPSECGRPAYDLVLRALRGAFPCR